MNNRSNPKRQLPAIVAALGITVFVGAVILALGANAVFNKNVASAQTAVATETVSPEIVNLNAAGDAATIENLQTLVSQYQAREAQYQTELAQAAEQLNQANAQVQQYQSLMTQLQNAGVIQLDANGQVTVMATNSFGGRPESSGQFGEHREHGDHGGFWGDND